MRGESAHVHLVEHELLDGMLELAVLFPIEVVESEARAMLVDAIPQRRLPPDVASGNGVRVGIAKDLRSVEAMAVCRVPRSGDAEAVLDLLVIEAEHDHGEDVAGAELIRERDLDHRLGFATAEQDKRATGGSARKDGKVDAERLRARAEWQRAP